MRMTTIPHGSCRDVNLLKTHINKTIRQLWRRSLLRATAVWSGNTSAWIIIDYFEGFPSATLCERGGRVVEKGSGGILFWWFFLQWWWGDCGQVPQYLYLEKNPLVLLNFLQELQFGCSRTEFSQSQCKW